MTRSIFTPTVLRWTAALAAALSLSACAPLVLGTAVGGAFVGLVLTLQGYRTLTTFGASDALATLLGLSLYRELGPVLTALPFIGRAGSSIAAEANISWNTGMTKMSRIAIAPAATVRMTPG